MKYGDLPKMIGHYKVEAKEMMFYQYLPIKLIGEVEPKYEDRLSCFNGLIGVCCCDFIGVFGLDRYVQSFVYLTAKFQWQKPGCSFNRPGYHSDGFMTDDINYVWSDSHPTIFNNSDFVLTQDDSLSLAEMEAQANPDNQFQFENNTLLRLNQFNIHRVANPGTGMRTFFKLSISKDKYDLEFNSRNRLLEYNWEYRARNIERNIPQILSPTERKH